MKLKKRSSNGDLMNLQVQSYSTMINDPDETKFLKKAEVSLEDEVNINNTDTSQRFNSKSVLGFAAKRIASDSTFD